MVAEENQLVIDRDFCIKSHIANDNWGRVGVTPFTVACYVWQALVKLNESPERVINAVTTHWDSLYWGRTSTPISLWNKLFNGRELTDPEWEKVVFPWHYIHSIETCITSPSSKKECYPVFYDGPHIVSNELLIVTKESYTKTSLLQQSSKVTAYRYGHATQMQNLIEGLRKEVTSVIIPLAVASRN